MNQRDLRRREERDPMKKEEKVAREGSGGSRKEGL